MEISDTIKSILHARKHNGLYSSIVIGPRGHGKSSYSLQTLYKVFRQLGYDEETSWNMALDRILFKIPEIVDFLDQAKHKKYQDCFIWDDAAVYGGGIRWTTHQKEMVLLESLCDTLRTAVYGILLTTPDTRSLSRRLRSYDEYLTRIYFPKYVKDKSTINPNLRDARVYRKSVLPAGQIRLYIRHTDRFNVMLPDWVYKKYMKKRRQYADDDIAELKKMLNNDTASLQ